MKVNPSVKIMLLISITGGIIGVCGGFLDDFGTGLIITVAMIFSFSLVYFVFIKPGLEYNRIIKTGKMAQATIISVNETGTRINNQPLVKFEVSVSMEGALPYAATIKSVVSYLNVSQFQPGAIFPVMVDSVNPQKVVFIKSGDIPANQVLANASPEKLKELEIKLLEMDSLNQSIRSTGVYAKAIVTKYTFMGVNVNGNNPLVTMEIQVLPHNEPAFPATVKAVIKQENISKYQPGEDIGVKYDVSDRSKVAIEHA